MSEILTDAEREMAIAECARRMELARELRALLAKHKTSLVEQSNGPMTGGVMGGGAA